MQKIHTLSILCLLLVLLPQTSRAQKKITGYRYWFDNDMATLQSQEIEGNGCQMTMDVSSLREGIHTLSIMFRNSEGKWSVPHSQPFYRTVSPQKTVAESGMIFLDGDASQRQSLSLKDGTIGAEIDVSKMTDGIHTAHVMIKGSNGIYSVPCQQTFIKLSRPAGQELLMAEYYFDSDYAPTMMRKSADGTLDAEADVSTLTAGIHTLTIRCLSSDGRWSTPYSQCFMKMPEKQAATADSVEYYFDGNGSQRHSMALSESRQLVKELPTDSLAEGLHMLAMRFKDSQGRWGVPYSQYFYVSRPLMLAGYEYWFNGNYDGKKKETLHDVRLGEGLKLNIDVSEIVASTSDDQPRCTLHLRFVTSRGEWSEVVVHEFTRASTEIALEDYEILKAFYKETGGDGWTNKWDISTNVISADNWYGVGFDQGRVYSLNLSGNNLTTPSRQLKETIFTLSALETLDLSKNGIEGQAEAIMPDGLSAGTILREIDLSHNLLAGDASALVNALPSLQKANLSHNRLTELGQLTNQDAALDLTSQFVNADNTIAEDAPCYDSPLAYALGLDMPSLFTCGNSPHITISSPSGQDMLEYIHADADAWALDNARIQEWHYDSDEYLVITLKNGIAKGSKAYVRLAYPAGDVNVDQTLDVTDLQSTLLYILEDYHGWLFNHAAADTHKDDQINVQDAVSTINMLLDQELPSLSAARSPERTDGATVSPDDNGGEEVTLYLKEGVVEMESTHPVAALHIQCENGFAWDFALHGMQQSTKESNVVAYSFDGTSLPVGRVAIGTYSSDPVIHRVTASDAGARHLRTRVVLSGATHMEGIPANESNDADIYTLSGIRMKKPVKGLNIVRKNGHHVKIIKK